ncbi:helix-turn-helix transcriptional regulator [Streptomyces sp. URMC 123]|uniref:helix-turn-helix transcriptional regulator n=1 Tax=Streptomyces sp. URMC 123 TaxID=3423403 RepID=UPI003F1AE8BF
MDRAELAHFLRTRRARTHPSDVGLASNGRRRIPGLRREEVAQLAGISPDYYMRLEQGRGPRPSRQVLTALSWALRLSNDERTYLLRLVGEAPTFAGTSREVPASVLILLERLEDVPAMVLDVTYDILAWNRMATALMVDFETLPVKERNTLRWLFFRQRPWLKTPDGWRFARECVADLRATGRYPEDPAVRELVDDLCAHSPEFSVLWAGHEIEVQRSTTKRSVHPLVGELELDCEMLVIPGRDQRLMFYTAAPGSPSHKALQSLKAALVTT